MNRSDPLVSIIVPTFNRNAMLQRALESCLNQTYSTYEIIVVDDCSDTKATVPNDPRIKLHRLSKNEGKAYAQNYGFDHSKGEYVVYLDDDNEFLPQFLEDSVRALRLAPSNVGGVRVGRWILQGNGIPEYKDYAAPFTHTGYESIDWGFLMKREVMENLKYDPLTYGDEDADFGIQFAQKYKSIPIDKPLQVAHAYINEGAITFPTERRLKALEYFIRKNLDFYRKDRNELRYLYRLAGRNFYSGGYKMKGLAYFFKSFKALPNLRTFKHLFFILFGWNIYNWYMDSQERKMAKERLYDFDLRRN